MAVISKKQVFVEGEHLVEVEVDDDSAMVVMTVFGAAQVTTFEWRHTEAAEIAAALAEAAPLAKAANEAPV